MTDIRVRFCFATFT